MMGLHSKQDELWCEPVNLARRIPGDCALRKLREVLDLSSVHQEVSQCYGRKRFTSLGRSGKPEEVAADVGNA